VSRSRRDRAAALLAKPGFRTILRRLPRWRGVVVLNYHRVGNRAGQPWDRTLWNADADFFAGQLKTIARHADVVTPEQVVALARENRRGRHVLLTFDDGYRDNYDIAFPLLRENGLTATFFPVAGFLDEGGAPWWDELAWMVRHATRETIELGDDRLPGTLPLGPDQDETIAALVALYKTLAGDQTDLFIEEVAEKTGAGRCCVADSAELWMSWDMVRELRAGGMSVGGHTMSHPILARLPIDSQEREIAGCADRLEQELGSPMRWFAYPVGARDTFTVDTQQLVREAGVELAFSFFGGFASFARWDSLNVPRVHVGPGHGPDLLQAMLGLPRHFARW
jgi:peptidoglycan/xylan/chitin deacetylase (PgdA/CDA1 family)